MPPNGVRLSCEHRATVLRCARASAARSLPCPTKHAVARQLHRLLGRRVYSAGTKPMWQANWGPVVSGARYRGNELPPELTRKEGNCRSGKVRVHGEK